MQTLETFTDHEAKRLAALELVIKGGRDSFLAVGLALGQINRDRLYRQEFATFEEYLAVRWDISKSRGYELIAFARDQQMSAIADKPANPWQSRKKRQKVIAEVASEPTSPPCPDEEETPHIKTYDEEFKAACGNPDIPAMKIEPAVVEYYSRLQELVEEALREATDKQLASMSVYAALVPKLIKDEQHRRKNKL